MDQKSASCVTTTNLNFLCGKIETAAATDTTTTNTTSSITTSNANIIATTTTTTTTTTATTTTTDQIQSYFTNLKQIPYSDLVIKLMNSKKYSYVNLRLMNFFSLLINLRDSFRMMTPNFY